MPSFLDRTACAHRQQKRVREARGQRREVEVTVTAQAASHGEALALQQGCAASSSGHSRVGLVSATSARRSQQTSSVQLQVTAVSSHLSGTAWHPPTLAACRSSP